MARVSKKTTRFKKITTPKKRVSWEKTPHEIRLNRFLALCGISSRRKADEYIKEGLVTVNGKKTLTMGYKITPSIDNVLFKGKPVKILKEHTYLVAYKPRNVLTTLSDPLDRPTIKDFIPKKYKKENLFPIGRLDWQSEGLLILTNDGEFAQNVLHPSKNVPKTYEIKVEGKVLEKDFNKLTKGVTIPGGKAYAIEVKTIKKSLTGSHTWLKITVVEGRNRLIRKMMSKLGYDVIRLRRTSIGSLKIGNLKAGDVTKLSMEKKDLVFQTPSYLNKLL